MLEKLRDGFDKTQRGRELHRRIAQVEKEVNRRGPKVQAMFFEMQQCYEELILDFSLYLGVHSGALGGRDGSCSYDRPSENATVL